MMEKINSSKIFSEQPIETPNQEIPSYKPHSKEAPVTPKTPIPSCQFQDFAKSLTDSGLAVRN